MHKNLLWYIRLVGILSICVLIFFCLMLTIYNRMSVQIRSDAVRQQKTYIQRGATILEDNYHLYCYKQFFSLQKQDELNSLARSVDSSRRYASMINAKSKIEDIIGAFSTDNPFYIVFTGNDGIAISANSIYHNLRQSIDSDSFRIDDMDYDTFIEYLQKNANSGYSTTKVQTVSLTSVSDGLFRHVSIKYLCIVKSMNTSYSAGKAYAIWLYNINTLHNILSGENVTNDFFAMFRNDDNVYLSTESMPDIPMGESTYYDSSDKSTYFRVKFPSLGLTAYISLSDKQVLTYLDEFYQLWNILLVAFALLCTILVLLLIFYFVKPVQHLYTKAFSDARPSSASGDVFEQIERRIDKLGDERVQMEHALSQLNGLLHSNLLGKLLRGNQPTPNEIDLLNSLPELTHNQHLRALLIGTLSQSLPVDSGFSAIIEEAIIKSFPTVLYSWIDSWHIAVIIDGNIASDKLALTLECIRTDLCDALHMPNGITVGAGRECENIRSIYKSYHEAYEAFFRTIAWKQSTIAFYEDSSGIPLDRCLAYNELKKMQTLLMSGHSQEACSILNSVSELLTDPAACLNDTTRQQLYDDIYGLMLRVSANLREPSILTSLPPRDKEFLTPEEWLKRSYAAFQYIADVAGTTSEDENPFSDALLKYITQYFSDPDITLSSVANAFSMSERSLSRYFKDKLRDTFSNVLENFRMSEAENLLLADKLTINDISSRVGYYNTSTFLKAFKRRYGLTPSEWSIKNRMSRTNTAERPANY